MEPLIFKSSSNKTELEQMRFYINFHLFHAITVLEQRLSKLEAAGNPGKSESIEESSDDDSPESLEEKIKEWWLSPDNSKNAPYALSKISEQHYAPLIEAARKAGYEEGILYGMALGYGDNNAFKNGHRKAVEELREKFDKFVDEKIVTYHEDIRKELFGE